MESYREQLLSDEWLIRRSKILSLDNHQCQLCRSKNNLNVHHKYYVKGRKVWEYPDSALMTLCVNCHEIIHERIKASKQKRIIKEGENPKHISEIIAKILSSNG